MKRTKTLVALLSGILVIGISPLQASQPEFEAGFIEGYKSVKGDMVFVPMTPIAPFTPLGSTPFREGIKAGIQAAKK